MLSNYYCAQMSNFKRLRLLGHTLRQGYDVRPVHFAQNYVIISPLLIKGKSSIAPERLYRETSRFSKKMVSAGVSMHVTSMVKHASSSLIRREPKSMESITSACYAISSFPNVVDSTILTKIT